MPLLLLTLPPEVFLLIVDELPSSALLALARTTKRRKSIPLPPRPSPVPNHPRPRRPSPLKPTTREQLWEVPQWALRPLHLPDSQVSTHHILSLHTIPHTGITS